MHFLLHCHSIAVVVAVGKVLALAVNLLAIGVAASCTPAAVASAELLLAIAHSVASIVRYLFVWHCAPSQTCQLSV